MTSMVRASVGLIGAGLLLTGCGVGGRVPVVPVPVVPQSVGVRGNVHGGQQPISGTKVYLYAVSTLNGGPAMSLLKGSGYVTTPSDGSFTITDDYTCPTGSYVYLLAIGGNPGVGVSNPEIALAAGLGLCSSLSASTFIQINEVTTVATVYALAQFATSETQIGTTSDLSVAFNTIASTVDNANGVALVGSQNVSVPQAKINSLANSIAACVNSSGVGAPCSTLMNAASVVLPLDTFQAVLNIAKNPTQSVGTIYDLGTPAAPFAPALNMAPSDWTVTMVDFNGPIGQDANTYRFGTTLGDIYVELRPDLAPKNVANFLYYVNNGLYNESFFHRLVAGFVLQGGGYTYDNGQTNAIEAGAPVVGEAKLSNLRGTVSMALQGTDPNSATNQFFFNLEDNTSLDNPSTQVQNGGYTVIGQIAGVQGYLVDGGYSTGLATMDAIGAESVYDLGPPFVSIPLQNYTSGAAGSNNLIFSTIAQMTTPAGTVATPLFSPVSYTAAFSANQVITLTDSTPGAAIYYYLFTSPGGGANPNQYATLYTGPFTLPASTYVVAYATATGYANQSLYNYEYYGIQ